MYKYVVDRAMIKLYGGDKEYVPNIVSKDIGRGYVFADNQDEAIRKIEALYPSTEFNRYDVKVKRTDIISL